MQSKRRWLPGWQRIELVGLCLDRRMSGRQAASYRHVSVSTVQYWIERYRDADEDARRSGEWRRIARPRRTDSRCGSVTPFTIVSAEPAGARVGGRG
jgi:hypothetical protein